MTALDRKTPPRAGEMGELVIPPYTTDVLANGVPIHVMRGGSQPIVKVDVVFDAGRLRAPKAMLAKMISNMLLEGTTTMSSREIAERLEFFGAYAWGTVTMRHAVTSILCLQKDVRSVVALMEDYVKNPSFPEDELRLMLSQEYQDYKVGMMKTGRVALRNINKLLYKEGCRYGRLQTEESFRDLSVDDLRAFHRQAYTQTGARVFISGQPSDEDVQFVADTFGRNWWDGEKWAVPAPDMNESFGEMYADMESEQTSVVMANRVMSNDDPDSDLFHVVDTVLGGYFSSRLMQNLRERLGLTYGVGSFVTANSQFGLHTIRTDIKKGEHERVVEEIRKEIRRLRDELVPQEELSMARNYMQGELMRRFDTTLTAADTVMGLLSDGKDERSSLEYYAAIRNMTAEQLREVARRWLDADAYGVSVAGVMQSKA